MKFISGGTYYGNGVSYSVDWNKAATCIVGMSIRGFLGGEIYETC